MRIIIYTGKGGVGKTSIAAATALHMANQGKRVLIMSTDQAHSLRDSFEIDKDIDKDMDKDLEEIAFIDRGNSLEKKFSIEGNISNGGQYSKDTGIIHISKDLDLLELNTIQESKNAWGTLQDYFKEIISQKANGGLEAEEALLFPGFEELFALLRILTVYEEGEYDVLVVDCAPTGETLSLLRYPERLEVIADKILPMVRNMNKAFGSFLSKKTGVPKPRDIVFAEFDQLIKRLNALRRILQNREITSLRLVMSPERIVIDEARRSYTWIQLYDFGVDAVYMNRIYPEKALKGYFEGWTAMQEESIALVKESFPDQRIYYLEMQDNEIRGIPMLEQIGSLLYYDNDPAEIFCKQQAFRLEDRDGTRLFIVSLPYAKKEELQVRKDGKELVLTFRNETRRFRLPDKLVRRYVSGWEYEDGEVIISMDYE